MPLPSAPFDPANSIFNGLSIIQVKIGANTYVYEATKLDDQPAIEHKPLARPGFDGIVRTVRRVRTKSDNKWTFALDEVKRLLELFSGSLQGSVDALITLWVPDVDDATGKCALKSEDDFAATISRTEGMTHGNSDFSKTSVVIESNADHDIVWTKDATIT